jgi:CHAT domain-containing protein/tetratricopeptide (TPR) repeat protein
MRCVRHVSVLITTALTGLLSCQVLNAQTVAPSSNRPTFDYTNETYEELTNSIWRGRQSLEAAESASGNSNTNVADLLNDLAGSYDDLGDYAQAASLDERCLAIREELLGPEDMKVADILSDLAWEYQEIGDYERALPLLSRSLVMTEKLVGETNFDVATTMNNMADVYQLEGDYARALPLCQRALEIRRKVLGQDHPDVSDSLLSLARIYRSLKDDRKALGLCKQSIDICERRLGHDQPLVTDSLFLLGQIQEDLGNYSEASSAFHHALAIEEKFSGSEHPDVLEALGELAVLYGKLNELGKSLSTSTDLFNRQRHYFIGQILASSDPEALRSIQNAYQSVEFFHSVCEEASSRNLGSAGLAGATELALNKALLEEVRAAQATFEADPRTATEELREKYHAAQVQLAHLGESGLKRKQLEVKQHVLQDELGRLEATLADHVGLVAQAIRERDLTLNDVARDLPSQSVLVDFIQYHRYDFAAETNQFMEQCYAAYLTIPLAGDSTNILVKRVDLGRAAPINESIALVCKRMSAGQFAARDLSAALERLSDLVYTPLARYLTNVSHIIICPDGQLSRVPFEMLPVGDKFLIEEKAISYVTSGREVVRFANSPAIDHYSRSVVLGNPDFDLDLTSTRPPAATVQIVAAPSGMRALTRDYNGLRFQPLPGAEVEARSVAELLGDDGVLLLGAKAREVDLKAVKSPRVLHLATHGFYFPDQGSDQTKAAGGFDQTSLIPYVKRNNDWENPMVRCGIALAGANHAMQITNPLAEDGLLTGLEASQLNLQGTELVILSACDSGTGELEIGEGMMSLRRAFLIAGAQTVLASHWNISDKATSQLMTEFIRRWHSGEPRVQAWREAQLSLLHSKDFSNPYFWAAFTLTGQWR